MHMEVYTEVFETADATDQLEMCSSDGNYTDKVTALQNKLEANWRFHCRCKTDKNHTDMLKKKEPTHSNDEELLDETNEFLLL